MTVSRFGLSPNRKVPTHLGLCGLHITDSGVAIAHVTWENDAPILACCDFLPSAASPELFLPALSFFVKKNKLDGIRCSWILQPCDYTLLSVGYLPVASSEVMQALSWHLKDRIDFPVAEASIDHFTIPPLNQSSKEDFIYAVVAKKAYLEKTANMIIESGLNLDIIDVPEFALRNIAAINSACLGNMAIIESNALRTSLLLIQNGLIYLIRQIEWDKKAGVEKLSLEIQRSLDYYENELGQPPVQQFYISPEYQQFFPELKSGLPFEIQDLSWDKLKDKRCFTAAGGALRQEGGL